MMMQAIPTERYYIQLELFPETPEQRLSREITQLKSAYDKVRKSLYAKHGELARSYGELKNELETLKRDMCRAQKIVEEQGSFL